MPDLTHGKTKKDMLKPAKKLKFLRQLRKLYCVKFLLAMMMAKPILDENGKEQTKKVKEKVFQQVLCYFTFDISQTEGEPILN